MAFNLTAALIFQYTSVQCGPNIDMWRKHSSMKWCRISFVNTTCLIEGSFATAQFITAVSNFQNIIMLNIDHQN